MTFLAANWWVFLIGTGFFALLAIFLQIRNMRHMAGDVVGAASSLITATSRARARAAWDETERLERNEQIFPTELTDPTQAVQRVAGGLFSRFKGVFVCGLLATGCGILMVIGVVVTLIDYFKTAT